MGYRSNLSREVGQWVRNAQERNAGSTEPSNKISREDVEALTAQALESGKVTVKKCPTYKKKKPDMRKKPRGY